jgi:2-polyprenyl-3-methyl-5-hydroxy-6-metoxy-1,4-benzoquinol methylase
MKPKDHWETVYTKKASDRLSWYQERPSLSLELIEATGLDATARVLDVGGGTSTLVDTLLAAGYTKIGVLDIAEHALHQVQQRLGQSAERVEWFSADVTTFVSPHQWDIWHDRAVLHFLLEDEARQAYRDTLLRSLTSNGYAIIATFGPTGPTRCSGLDVQRYGSEMLCQLVGSEFVLVESQVEGHHTPSGAVQDFLYCLFRRSGSGPEDDGESLG